MLTKTDIIKGMFRYEVPINAMIQAPIYKDKESPFRCFRDGVKLYANITHSNQNSENDGVDFFDPELDIDEIDRYIKVLASAEPRFNTSL